MLHYKPWLLILAFAACISLLAITAGRPENKVKKTVEHISRQYWDAIQQFDSALAVYPTYYLDSSYSVRKEKFNDLLYRFKKTEWLLAYLDPQQIYQTFLKPAQFEGRDWGPPLPDNWIWLGPFGIDPDSVLQKKTRQDSIGERKLIERSTTGLRKALHDGNYGPKVAALTESDIFEALRLQMFRISTIGIANGDFVVDEAWRPAFTGAYHSWADVVGQLAALLPESHKQLKEAILYNLDGGAQVLDRHKDLVSFDRMDYLQRYLLPLSAQLQQLQNALNIAPITKFSAVQPTAKHIYDANIFNADYFAPGEEAYFTPEKAELGKILFFDPILSDNNERACASCHKPELAFTDGMAKSVRFDRADLPRNAPTVINSCFQKLQFWDLRATSLEDQLDSVINSPDELHSNFENVTARINSSKEYQSLFHAAFPETKQGGIQRSHIKMAIAVYERELTGLNSRFDQYMRGDKTKMNSDEIAGFNLFMGSAKCGSCHYAPLFNGALPPYFDYTDHRSIGVPLKDTMNIFEVDPDAGFSKPSQNQLFNFSFKIPTVRNAGVTAPYMHNGVYKTLDQVINFYDHAGGNEFFSAMKPGLKGLPFFMILPQKLKLTEVEKKQIIAFIHTLTDTTAAQNVPTRLPKLEGKYASLNKRKLGGIY
jgi:cytochrome c peroxidase